MSAHPDFLHAKFNLVARFMSGASATASAMLAKSSRSVSPDPNIIGVAIGEKNNEEDATGVTSVRMFVKKKLPKSQLSKKQLIPASIEGLPVDVVQTGTFKARAAPVNPQKRIRPAPAGCSVGYDLEDGTVMAGTFGALVTDSKGRLYILSNNHVLAAEDALKAGAAIFQPGLLDGGKPSRDQIAKLTKAIKMKTAGANAVDAAIAEVLKKSDVSAEIPVIGKPTGKRDAVRNIIVHKFGRTTSYTTGYVTDTDALVQVEYDKGTITFDEQIVIHSLDRKKFSDGGDSGSLIVEKPTGKAVGLLFAGGTGYTLANPIGAVLKALKVQLVTKA
ncbi:MAG: hypothetical protein R3F13_15965 [Prosthecobacter sp.]